jgi:hypothetical protein
MEAQSKSRFGRRVRWTLLVVGLMGVSFMAGAALTAVFAARIVLPLAAAGFAGLAVSSSQLSLHILYAGDSTQRREVLSALQHSLIGNQGSVPDPAAATWLRPALEQCATDPDPEVAAMARELLDALGPAGTTAESTDVPSVLNIHPLLQPGKDSRDADLD